MELSKQNINEVLNNGSNAYYGHGTNGDMNIINSIFNIGLRCSHGSMYFTTCTLGKGGEMDDDIIKMLNKWPHLSAEKVVIVSEPIKYNIIDSPSLGTYHLTTNAYCYEIEGKGNYVMPEFLIGYYDAPTKTFNKNPRYYELLSEEEQKILFDKVKLNYFNTIENACGIEYYREIIKDLPEFEFPLTDDEVASLMSRKSDHKIHV